MSEKATDQYVDDVLEPSDKESQPPTHEIEFNDAETKRLLQKVDWRLLPVLTALYLMSFLDRSNSMCT